MASETAKATDQRPKIAALVADAFQEEEYFFPKVALERSGLPSQGCVLSQGARRDVQLFRADWPAGCRPCDCGRPGPRTMWRPSFQAVQKALPCLPKILA